MTRHDAAQPAGTGSLVALIVAGGFMAGLDTSLVNVGLTSIAASLHIGLSEVQWVTSGYLLALAAALPACAWLQRLLGASRLWILSLVLFAGASLLCAVAPSLPVLVVARLVQGAAGGLLVPTGQKIVAEAVGLDRIGRTLSFAALAIVLAPALGPAIGGMLVDVMSWRWLFAVNLPVAAVALALAPRILPRNDPGIAARLDVAGFALLATGIPVLSLGLAHIGSQGRDIAGFVLTGAGASMLALFVVDALRPGRPPSRPSLIDIGLFRNPAYSSAQACVFFSGLGMFGGLVLLPLYFEELRGLPVSTTGLLLLAYGGGAMAALPIAGRLADRFGGGLTCVFGLAITIAATAPFMFLPAQANIVGVEFLHAIRGIGVGLTGIPAMTATLRAAPGHLGDATTTANILQRIGGGLGSALIVILVARPSGVTAYQACYAMLVATAICGLVAALVLARCERRGTGTVQS